MNPLNILAGQLVVIDAEPLLQRLLFASVEAAALALAVAVLIRLARFRSPRLTCLLWLVVLLKPLVSLAVGSPLPILRLEKPVSLTGLPLWSPPTDLPDEYSDPAFAALPMAVAAEGRVSEDTGAFAARPQAPVSIEEAPEPLLTAETVPTAIAAVWLAGLVVFLAVHLHARLRLHRIIRASRPASPGLASRYRELAGQLRIRRVPRLLVTNELESPAMVGLLRPTVLIPAWLAAQPGDPKLDWSMRHELTHWKWLDPVSVLVRDVTAILFWFHPVAWQSGRRLTEAMELACDRAMVRDAADATNYADQLFRILQNLRERRRPAVAGGLFATRTQVGKRIAALLDGSSLRRPQLTRLSAVGLTVLAGVSLAIGVATTRPADSQPSDGRRVLHFPADRSLGMVYVRDANLTRQIETYYHHIDGVEDKWEYIGEAQGDVPTPEGKRTQLRVSEKGCKNLSPLADLGPNDLDELCLYYIPATDGNMRHVGRLTGLKVLHLEMTNIGDDGLKQVRGMKSLERLYLPNGLTDAGLVHVGQVQSLKALHFGGNRATDAGLVHVAKLANLEELSLGGTYQDKKGKVLPSLITDAGLVQLARLPRLQYLALFGDFSDAGLVHLKNLPSLRNLNLSHLKITDAGLANLAGCTQVETLSLYNTKVTDQGLVHLKSLRSLTKLDLNKEVNDFDHNNPPITDAGAVHLKEIKTLEHLSLPPMGLTDVGLASLAELDRLKYLWVGTSGLSKITDAGLKHLSRLRSLEELHVGGEAFSGDGLASLADMPNLRKLYVNGSLAQGGLASLAGLRSLEELDIFSSPKSIGISEINRLSGLRELRYLNIGMVVRDGAILNITGLSRLETLRLLMAKSASFGDEDLACVAGMKNLKWLAISKMGGHCSISDAGMVHLAGLTSLERLWISGPSVTDRGLAEVANLRNLWDLGITGNFTDAGLRHIEGLTGLRRLTINSGKNLSPSAVAGLRKALPNANPFNVDKDRAIPSTQTAAKALKVGDVAPAFSVETMDGKEIKLADYQGKAVLLYFWATWCSPCVASTPNLKEFEAALSKEHKDFAMISLSMDDAEVLVQNFVKKHDLGWTQTRIGINSQIAADYGVEGAPEYFVIGPDGTIASTDKDWNKLETAVAAALVKK